MSVHVCIWKCINCWLHGKSRTVIRLRGRAYTLSLWDTCISPWRNTWARIGSEPLTKSLVLNPGAGSIFGYVGRYALAFHLKHDSAPKHHFPLTLQFHGIAFSIRLSYWQKSWFWGDAFIGTCRIYLHVYIVWAIWFYKNVGYILKKFFPERLNAVIVDILPTIELYNNKRIVCTIFLGLHLPLKI